MIVPFRNDIDGLNYEKILLSMKPYYEWKVFTKSSTQ